MLVLTGCNDASQAKVVAAGMELARCGCCCMLLMRAVNSNDDVLSIRQHLASKLIALDRYSILASIYRFLTRWRQLLLDHLHGLSAVLYSVASNMCGIVPK